MFGDSFHGCCAIPLPGSCLLPPHLTYRFLLLSTNIILCKHGQLSQEACLPCTYHYGLYKREEERGAGEGMSQTIRQNMPFLSVWLFPWITAFWQTKCIIKIWCVCSTGFFPAACAATTPLMPAWHLQHDDSISPTRRHGVFPSGR